MPHPPDCRPVRHCLLHILQDTVLCCSPLKRRRVEDTDGAGNGAAGAVGAADLGNAASDAAQAGDAADGDREMVDMAEDIEDVAALPPQVSAMLPLCCSAFLHLAMCQ